MSDVQNNNIINRAAKTLSPDGNEKDVYYVYALCDEHRNPFYIGKGKGYRVFNHEKEIEAIIEEEEKYIKNTDEYNELDASEQEEYLKEIKKQFRDTLNAKQDKINELGGNVKKVIIKWGLTEKEAYMAESALINMCNFTNDTTTGEDSLTNIVNGHASKREKESYSPETKARTVEEFIEECAPNTIEYDKIENIKVIRTDEKSNTRNDKIKILFIKINKTYKKCYDYKYREWAIFEATRGCWTLNMDRCKKADFVFSLYNNFIVGIYPVNKNCWVRNFGDDFPQFPEEDRKEVAWKMLIDKDPKLSYEALAEKYKDAFDKAQKEYDLDKILNEYAAGKKREEFDNWIKEMFNLEGEPLVTYDSFESRNKEKPYWNLLKEIGVTDKTFVKWRNIIFKRETPKRIPKKDGKTRLNAKRVKWVGFDNEEFVKYLDEIDKGFDWKNFLDYFSKEILKKSDKNLKEDGFDNWKKRVYFKPVDKSLLDKENFSKNLKAEIKKALDNLKFYEVNDEETKKYFNSDNEKENLCGRVITGKDFKGNENPVFYSKSLK